MSFISTDSSKLPHASCVFDECATEPTDDVCDSDDAPPFGLPLMVIVPAKRSLQSYCFQSCGDVGHWCCCCWTCVVEPPILVRTRIVLRLEKKCSKALVDSLSRRPLPLLLLVVLNVSLTQIQCTSRCRCSCHSYWCRRRLRLLCAIVELLTPRRYLVRWYRDRSLEGL